MAKKVVIAGACRTAIGKMGGVLSTVPAVDMGSIVIKEALKRAGVPADQVDHVYMGCVIQAGLGQNVARQASLNAGLPIETPAVTVNVVCGSGLNCVNMAAQMIQAEEEGASYENKLMCGLVAMNRVKDKSYPNTLEEVIFQKDKKGNVQYACIKSAKGKKARIYLEPNEDSLRAAKEILSKNCSIKIPEEVVFQSERPLGSGVYKKIGNQYYSYK